MRKTIHDEAYDALLSWLKGARIKRKQESKGSCTMRDLVPRVMFLLGRPQMKFSWIAKIEQKERRLDILEYVAYCLALGVDPHEGVQLIIDHLSAESSTGKKKQKASAVSKIVLKKKMTKHSSQQTSVFHCILSDKQHPACIRVPDLSDS